jgi:hypothetical protein
MQALVARWQEHHEFGPNVKFLVCISLSLPVLDIENCEPVDYLDSLGSLVQTWQVPLKRKDLVWGRVN